MQLPPPFHCGGYLFNNKNGEVRLTKRSPKTEYNGGSFRISNLVIDTGLNEFGVIRTSGPNTIYIESITFKEEALLEWVYAGRSGYDVFFVYIKSNDSDIVKLISRMRLRHGDFGVAYHMGFQKERNGYYSIFMDHRRPWTSPPAPEPTTTGAVIAALGLTITACRKHRTPKTQSIE